MSCPAWVTTISPQLAAALENAQIARVVKVHILIDGMQFDSLETEPGDARKLAVPAGKIRMHAAEGKQAVRTAETGGCIVDMLYLERIGGNRQDDGKIDPGARHGCLQAALGTVGKCGCVREMAELFDGGGRDSVRKSMRMEIDDHIVPPLSVQCKREEKPEPGKDPAPANRRSGVESCACFALVDDACGRQ